MKEPIEYQHFANLVERVAVYTERLENVCRNLEQYKVEIKSDIKEIDDRMRILEKRQNDFENQQNNHKMAVKVTASIGKYAIGSIITAITIFLYYHMSNLTNNG